MATLARQRLGSPAPPVSPRVRRRRRQRRISAAISHIGELLITGGVVVLLFVAYLLWWTDVVQAKTQRQLTAQIEAAWADPDSPAVTLKDVPLGSGIAVLYIPRFGADYHQVVVQGTEEDDLSRGPGHYVGTPLPGGVGNVAIAGHRTTWGHPFKQMATMRPGDEIVIKTAAAWYTYKADTEIAVDPTKGYAVVTADPPPVPAHDGWAAWTYTQGSPILTLTTCTPMFSAAQRLVLHARLVRTEPRAGNAAPLALQPHQGVSGARY